MEIQLLCFCSQAKRCWEAIPACPLDNHWGRRVTAASLFWHERECTAGWSTLWEIEHVLSLISANYILDPQNGIHGQHQQQHPGTSQMQNHRPRPKPTGSESSVKLTRAQWMHVQIKARGARPCRIFKGLWAKFPKPHHLKWPSQVF